MAVEHVNALTKRWLATAGSDSRVLSALGVWPLLAFLAVAAYDNRDAKLADERLDKVPQDQRGWEWAYLKQQSRGGLFTLYGHTSVVRSVGFSPDGARIVTGSFDRTARVWNVADGRELLRLNGHTNQIFSVAFSLNGRRIVTGSRDRDGDPLAIDPELTRKWLVSFLKDEVVRRRGFKKGLVGLSGGVDSALTAFLAAAALGKDNVIGVRMPYRTSSPDSLVHAQLVIDTLGIQSLTVDISDAVDGLLKQVGNPDPHRIGNIMARARMIVLFDLSAKHQALPLGTSNKSERLLGYFTWHGDDAPPVNPLGDLFKTQVWQLAKFLGVPDVIVSKPASADLIEGQTDEGDFGISYAEADAILNWLLSGYNPASLVARGFDADKVELVRKRLAGTHWKRKLPTVALLSSTGIGESYLRPVDY